MGRKWISRLCHRVPFTSASQAVPGARMRPHPYLHKKGRPKSYKVLRREQRPYEGNVIVFDDGGIIKISDAKVFGWLVLENGKRK